MTDPSISVCPRCKRPPNTAHAADASGGRWRTYCPGCGLSAGEENKDARAVRGWERLVNALAPPEPPSVSATYLEVHERLDRLGVPQIAGEYLVRRSLRLIARCEAVGLTMDHDGTLDPLAQRRQAAAPPPPPPPVRAKPSPPQEVAYTIAPIYPRPEAPSKFCADCGAPMIGTTCGNCGAAPGT